ncbi:MAG: transposase [Actinobacteria bacterium]|nr:transposase [Actinomycetota bacterium]
MDKYFDRAVLDLYTDYLLSSFGRTTATGLSDLLDGEISHDRISRFLSTDTFSSADLWHSVKPLIREVQSEEAVLIMDDSLLEKPYTDESELVCWHWDHSKGMSTKGLNLLSALYRSPLAGEISLPVAFELVSKPQVITDAQTGRTKRKAEVTKNELFRRMLKACVDNRLPFRYVLNDVWYAAAENMRFIKLDLNRDFVMPLKSNRKVALSESDKAQSRYTAVSELRLTPTLRTSDHSLVSKCVSVWLEGVPFPILLCKQVFTNEDGSQGTIYLVTSDTTLTSDRAAAIYRTRWKVEEYHKSVKSNASAEKSPTRTVRTQTNHVVASLLAYVKLEQLRMRTRKNHFAMKAQLYLRAIKSAFQELQQLQASCSTA